MENKSSGPVQTESSKTSGQVICPKCGTPFAAGEKNRKYFLEFMNRPNRYISRDALSLSSVVSFEELKEFYKDKRRYNAGQI